MCITFLISKMMTNTFLHNWVGHCAGISAQRPPFGVITGKLKCVFLGEGLLGSEKPIHPSGGAQQGPPKLP